MAMLVAGWVRHCERRSHAFAAAPICRKLSRLTNRGGSVFLRLPKNTCGGENTMKATKSPLLALTSALMAATSASSASAWENPLENPYLAR
jgi:hypothetical protein